MHPLHDRDLVEKKGSRFLITTPALLLDLDALEENIRTMASLAKQHGVNLRPHCKSHKSARIAKLQVEAGAVGISCATIGEAEVMVQGGILGVLITSPVVHPRKIERLVKLNEKAQNLMVVVDNPHNIEALAEANAQGKKPLQLLIDFDIGQRRTGVVTKEEGLSLAEQIGKNKTLKLVGLQAYGGHLQHIASYSERKILMDEQASRIEQLGTALEKLMGPSPIITGGGTGSFDIDLKRRVYTELQVGSYLFMDAEYFAVGLLPDKPAPFKPALFVLASVVSTGKGRCTIDAGLKAFATDGPAPQVFSGAPQGTLYRFMGDEHGGLILPRGAAELPLGHVVECLIPHCDPTINLYDTFHCVRKDLLVDIWPIDARGLH
jgi:3-hydroxy-D-aspartate aldolase